MLKEAIFFKAMANLRVFDINPGSSSSSPRNFFSVGDSLFFTADDGITGSELWRSDGKSTTRVKDIYVGDYGSDPTPIKEIGDNLYFSARDSASGVGLWKANGSTATRLSEYSLFEYAVIGNSLYFTADTPSEGREPWKTDGINTTLLSDILTGYKSSNPANFAVINETLYFTATFRPDPKTLYQTARVLWKTNGSTVTPISEVTPGSKVFSAGLPLYF
ncbi:MAG: hypothetical protein ACK5FE_14165, partial [Cyanobacteriota bacterium]